MLATLRKHSNGFVMKLLLTLLALTFVLWGVGDFMRGSGNGTVLKVGSKTFSAVELAPILKSQIHTIESRLQYKFKPEDLQDKQFMQLVLNQIINKMLLEEAVHDMKLLVSDDMIKYELASTPMFLDNGKFSKELFERFLKETGRTEDSLINNMKIDMPIQNFVSTYSVLRMEPTILKEVLFKARSQIRKVQLLTVPQSIAKSTTTPNQDELVELYNSNLERFTNLETRDVAYVSFDLNNISGDFVVTDEQAQHEYESKKRFFAEQEKRAVSQLIFQNKEQAEAALAQIKSGEPFNKVATQLFPDKKSFSMGEVSKSSFTEEIGGPIFAAKNNDITGIIQSPLGYHIFYIDSITLAKTKSFEEAKAQIVSEIQQERKYSLLNAMIADIEQMATTNTLEQIAAKYQLKIAHELGLLQTPTADKGFLASVAFATNEGAISGVMPYPTSNDKFIVVSVEKVQPKTQKDLESVKKHLSQIWVANDTNKKLSDFAYNLYSNLKDGKTAVEVAIKSTPLTTKTIEISFLTKEQFALSGEVLDVIFNTNKGDFSHPILLSTGEFMIVKVLDIHEGDTKAFSEHIKKIDLELTNDLPNEMYSEMLAALRKRYKVEMDEKYFERGEYF